jgi:hypothetical protein
MHATRVAGPGSLGFTFGCGLRVQGCNHGALRSSLHPKPIQLQRPTASARSECHADNQGSGLRMGFRLRV